MGVESILRVKTYNEEFSTLLNSGGDKIPGSAIGSFNSESGEIEVSQGRLDIRLDGDPDFADAVDFIRYHLFHFKPMFGVRAPVYNPHSRKLER